jgi:hypothetical protein
MFSVRFGVVKEEVGRMGNRVVFARRETYVTAVGFCVGCRTDASLSGQLLVLLSLCLNGRIEIPFYTI